MAVAFGRRVAFEHNSECVDVGRNVGLEGKGGSGGRVFVVGA